MELRCCDIDKFCTQATKVLHSAATTSHVTEVDAKREKLCKRTRTIRALLAERLVAKKHVNKWTLKR